MNAQNKKNEELKLIQSFKNIYKENFLFEIQRIKDSRIDNYEKQFIEYSINFNINLIGSNNIKYENAADYNAHDALLCIAQKSTINQNNRLTEITLNTHKIKYFKTLCSWINF